MTTLDLSAISKQFFDECNEDYVGLWSLVWHIRRAGMMDDSAVIQAALSVLLPLLLGGQIIAGQFEDKTKFQEWNLRPPEVIRKIESEWRMLGRDPSLGEIAWFTAR
jgi:hypothetical protein